MLSILSVREVSGRPISCGLRQCLINGFTDLWDQLVTQVIWFALLVPSTSSSMWLLLQDWRCCTSGFFGLQPVCSF